MKNKILLGVSGVKGVKTIVFLFLCLLMILPLSSCYNKENREEILKVYNWADYIDEDVLAASPTIMPCLTCGEPVASYIIRCTYL